MLSKVSRQVNKLFISAFSSSKDLQLYEMHFSRASNPATMKAFWAEQAKMLDWYKDPTIILDKSNAPFFRWFPDGIINMSYNCLDRHAKNGLGSKPAILYESPMINMSVKYTYGELLNLVSRFANVLQRHGVNKGDRVVIYMPNIPEVVIAMHACARIGALHSVVYGSFTGPELATRIIDAKPKVVISASCGIDATGLIDYKSKLNKAHQIAGMPELKNIIVQRDIQRCEMRNGIDFDFYDELDKAKNIDAIPLKATDHYYLLYTSGTTGKPKGLLRDIGSSATALIYAMKYHLSLGQDETFFMASDIGWATAHFMIMYGPQLAGLKAVLYEGKSVGTPDAGAFWRICEKHRVNGLCTAPTSIRAIRKEDPHGEHIRKADLSSLKRVHTGGERLDGSTRSWLKEVLPKTCQVFDMYGQTEGGFQLSGAHSGLHESSVKIGSAGKPSPGYNMAILDEQGVQLSPNQIGAICLKHPTPPGFACTIYQKDDVFVKEYMSQFPGHYFTGDAGYLDDEGDLFVVARLTDMIKTIGRKINASYLEEILTKHLDVVEAAIIGARHDTKGEEPVGFIVLRSGTTKDDAEIERECIKNVQAALSDLGTLASFNLCIVIDKLPKTKSGKVVRSLLKNLVDNDEPRIPATIEDASVVDVIRKQLEERDMIRRVADTVSTHQHK